MLSGSVLSAGSLPSLLLVFSLHRKMAAPGQSHAHAASRRAARRTWVLAAGSLCSFVLAFTLLMSMSFATGELSSAPVV